MSAFIRQLVLRQRSAKMQTEAAAEHYTQLLAEAKGENGSAPEHEWSGTKLRFRNPDGTWGKWVDLRGPKGAKGSKGEAGAVSIVRAQVGAGADLSALPFAAIGPHPELIAVRQNGQWVAATWAQIATWLSAGIHPAAITVNGEMVTVDGATVTTG